MILNSMKDGVKITKLLCYFKKVYGESIMIHWGHKHNYLGMDLDFSEKDVLGVSMILKINSIFVDVPEIIDWSSSKSHNENLFRMQDEAKMKVLPEEQAVEFHHSVAQLLFLTMRVHRDIQKTVLLLTIRLEKLKKDK